MQQEVANSKLYWTKASWFSEHTWTHTPLILSYAQLKAYQHSLVLALCVGVPGHCWEFFILPCESPWSLSQSWRDSLEKSCKPLQDSFNSANLQWAPREYEVTRNDLYWSTNASRDHSLAINVFLLCALTALYIQLQHSAVLSQCSYCLVCSVLGAGTSSPSRWNPQCGPASSAP